MVTAFIPVFYLETGMTASYLRVLWPFILIILLILGGMNAFFISNRRLFRLLESEDWPALHEFLEEKIYREKRYSARYVRLLAQTCLAVGDFSGAARLESLIALVKPALVDENALVFGIARILGKDEAGAVDFFHNQLEKKSSQDPEWLRWFYGFSLVLGGYHEKAGDIFEELSVNAKNIVVTGLSAFLLSQILAKYAPGHVEWYARTAEVKNRVVKILKSADKWKKKADKTQAEVQGSVIRKYLENAGEWLFREYSL